MEEDASFEEHGGISADESDEQDLITRRNLLVAAKRWSKAAIACALGAAVLAEGEEKAEAGYGTWVNRRGGWINGASGWVNRGGGGGWVNRAGGWINGGG